MLACDFCDDWFHFDCVGLTPHEVKMLGKYKVTCIVMKFHHPAHSCVISAMDVQKLKKENDKKERSKPDEKR